MKMRWELLFLAAFCTVTPCPPPTADDSNGKVATVAVPGGGKAIMARTDMEGAVHLLFDTDGGPRYAKSTDVGATFSAAIPVVSGGSQPAGLEYSTWDLAVGKGGRVHAAM